MIFFSFFLKMFIYVKLLPCVIKNLRWWPFDRKFSSAIWSILVVYNISGQTKIGNLESKISFRFVSDLIICVVFFTYFYNVLIPYQAVSCSLKDGFVRIYPSNLIQINLPSLYGCSYAFPNKPFLCRLDLPCQAMFQHPTAMSSWDVSNNEGDCHAKIN